MFVRFPGEVFIPKVLRKGEELLLLRCPFLSQLLLVQLLLFLEKSFHVFSSRGAELTVMIILSFRFDLGRATYLRLLSLNRNRPLW